MRLPLSSAGSTEISREPVAPLPEPEADQSGHPVAGEGGPGEAVDLPVRLRVVKLDAALDHLDLLLGLLVDHVADQRGDADGVLLVLEQLELERALQPLVLAEVERLEAIYLDQIAAETGQIQP